jgi:putative membrane protein
MTGFGAANLAAGTLRQIDHLSCLKPLKLRIGEMNRLTLAAATVLSLALGATSVFAQSVGEKTGVNSVLGVAPTTADFVKEAALSDLTEIATSKLAQDRGDADAKTFASQMITDHTKTSAELKALVGGDLKAALPTTLDETHQKKVDKLRDAKAEDFTSDYAAMQVSAHKDAVSLFERYAKGGEDPKLKDWAGKTLPHLQHHLEMAQSLNKKK